MLFFLLNSPVKYLSQVFQHICCSFDNFRDIFYYKFYLNELKFNVGPYVKINKIFNFSESRLDCRQIVFE